MSSIIGLCLHNQRQNPTSRILKYVNVNSVNMIIIKAHRLTHDMYFREFNIYHNLYYVYPLYVVGLAKILFLEYA